jgi:hypothetical protein
MQASRTLPIRPALLLRRVAAAVHTGPMLSRRDDPPRRPEFAAGPVPPPTWQPIPGRRIVTASQTFMAYACAGAEVRLHSVAGLPGPAVPAGGLVARVALGSHSVRVHADVDAAGYEARWTSAGAAYQLSARPVTLAEFMDLLLSMDWG